jgi:hypothetical protein
MNAKNSIPISRQPTVGDVTGNSSQATKSITMVRKLYEEKKIDGLQHVFIMKLNGSFTGGISSTAYFA